MGTLTYLHNKNTGLLHHSDSSSGDRVRTLEEPVLVLAVLLWYGLQARDPSYGGVGVMD